MGWPWVHPVLVHLPVAFLTTAPIAAVAWALRDNASFRAIWLWQLVVGTLGAVAAYLTGEAMIDRGFAASEARIAQHEAAAGWLLGLAVPAALLACIVVRRGWRQRSVRVACALATLLVAAITIRVGHLGGSDTWPELVNAER